jgi:hypothetical protein
MSIRKKAKTSVGIGQQLQGVAGTQRAQQWVDSASRGGAAKDGGRDKDLNRWPKKLERKNGQMTSYMRTGCATSACIHAMWQNKRTGRSTGMCRPRFLVGYLLSALVGTFISMTLQCCTPHVARLAQLLTTTTTTNILLS